MRSAFSIVLGWVLLQGLAPSVCQAEDIAGKLRSIIIPSIELTEVPLTDLLEFLQTRSLELDLKERKGVNIILNADDSVGQTPITLNLRNVTLGRVLWFVGQIARVDIRVDRHAVLLVPSAEKPEGATGKSRPDPAIARKLNSIIVPSVEFTDTPFPDALQFLRDFAVQLDKSEPDPQKRGVNIVRIPPREATEEKSVTMRLRNVPLSEAIRYTCSLAEYDIRVAMGAVIVSPKKPKTPKQAENPPFAN